MIYVRQNIISNIISFLTFEKCSFNKLGSQINRVVEFFWIFRVNDIKLRLCIRSVDLFIDGFNVKSTVVGHFMPKPLIN